nr:hypothetical protein [Acaryochloris sp. 'Moss Beach']
MTSSMVAKAAKMVLIRFLVVKEMTLFSVVKTMMSFVVVVVMMF